MSLLHKLNDFRESDYDREKFVKLTGTWQDLQEWKETLSKDPYDISTILDFAGAAGFEPQKYTSTPDGPLIAATELDRTLSDTTETLSRYVERNKPDFYDELSGEQLFAITQNIGLYRDETDEKHNELVDALKEVRGLEEISKDSSKIGSYIENKLKDAPNWLKESYYILSGNDNYIKNLFQFYAIDAQRKLTNLIVSEDGKNIDKDKIKDAIEKSLEIAYDEFKDEDNPGAKSDIWEKSIRPWYLLMANVLYPQEKKELKIDRDEDLEERKAYRREIGMAA
ncbi:hypothetical protein K9L16_00910 [Candidatus Pacearchaeota archaeon]|nr:hypothetical protein [Candidatus Pacearchaeota archaeon]